MSKDNHEQSDEKKNEERKQVDPNIRPREGLSEERKKQLEDETEQLEALLKAIKAIEAEKKKKGSKGPNKRPILAIEFGGVFHPHPLVNLMVYYVLNLTVIYGVATLFGFGDFSDSLATVLLFSFIYTIFETFFRAYVIMNHFRFVMQTFGFIFYAGYLTLFFLIDWFIFPNSVRFVNATLFVVFVMMFVFFRYIIAQLLKQLILRRGVL